MSEPCVHPTIHRYTDGCGCAYCKDVRRYHEAYPPQPPMGGPINEVQESRYQAIELRLAEAETRLTYLRKAQEVDQAAYQRLAARAVAALEAMAEAQASPVRTARKPTPRRASRAGSGTARAPRSPKRAPRR